MSLPRELTEQDDFMVLYQAAILGASDAERVHLDSLLALSFVRGQLAGLDEVLRRFRESEATRVQ